MGRQRHTKKRFPFALALTFMLMIISLSPDCYGQEDWENSYLATNEVLELDACVNENSVCGFLQSTGKNIMREQLCRCPPSEMKGVSSSCPMAWSPKDGQTVGHGYQQYKFCGKAPSLAVCEPDQPAYTGRLVLSRRSGAKTGSMDEMHCYCPETHTYHLTRQTWLPVRDADREMVEFSYVCIPWPTCRMHDICKTVTKNREGDTMVETKCNCGEGLHCPTTGSRRSQRFYTSNGRMDVFWCQSARVKSKIYG